MKKDFWLSKNVVVVGAGAFGTVLSQILSQNCKQVSLWVRSEEEAKEVKETRINKRYIPDLKLNENIYVSHSFENLFSNSENSCVLFVLPARVTREISKKIAPFLDGDEIIFHATKGVEEGTLKRVSEILIEELPTKRVGVISGPNLAMEVSRGDPSATVIASNFQEVIDAGVSLFTTKEFRVYRGHDVIGIEWSGTLKNVLAIAAGCLDALKLGWNARAFLISRGLAEIVRFGVAMGGKKDTFMGLAGVGDLLATCGSVLSRNYRVGYYLGEGATLNQALEKLGDSTVEGVRTSQLVWNFAQERKIYMPITQAVYELTQGGQNVESLIRELLSKENSNE